MTLQQINISLISEPTDCECKNTHMIVETSWINSQNKLEQNKFYLKGIDAETAFSMFKDIILREEDKDGRF